VLAIVEKLQRASVKRGSSWLLLLLRTQGDNFSCKRVSLLLHFIVNKTVALNGEKENARIKAPQRTGIAQKFLFLSPPLQTARGVPPRFFIVTSPEF
jgi:hypothetical protein